MQETENNLLHFSMQTNTQTTRHYGLEECFSPGADFALPARAHLAMPRVGSYKLGGRIDCYWHLVDRGQDSLHNIELFGPKCQQCQGQETLIQRQKHQVEGQEISDIFIYLYFLQAPQRKKEEKSTQKFQNKYRINILSF